MMNRSSLLFPALLVWSVLQGCTHCPRVESEVEIRRDVVVAHAASRLRAEARNGDIVVRAGTEPGEVHVTSHVVGIGPTAEEAEMMAEHYSRRCPIYTTFVRAAPIEVTNVLMGEE